MSELTDDEREQIVEVIEGWDEDEGFVHDPDDVYELFCKLVRENDQLYERLQIAAQVAKDEIAAHQVVIGYMSVTPGSHDIESLMAQARETIRFSRRNG